MTTWSPAEHAAVISAWVAAIPEEKADAMAALEVAQRALERAARRVGGARVVEVLDELADRALREGRGLVDGRDDRAVRGVGLEARVDDAGAEVVAAHRASASSRSARVRMPVARPCSVTISA